ncbi:MAG: hypothetical protein HQL25_02570 [Candidatus Omnitrophica bacterium]|nr:hypothetical protein [Candidatus Omnitrophota bacterium]
MKKKTYFIWDRDKWHYLAMFFWAWLRREQLVLVEHETPGQVLRIVEQFKFLKKYLAENVSRLEGFVGNTKGLYYQVTEEAVRLTEIFYSREFKNDFLSLRYRSFYKSDKIDAYLKKSISDQMFSLLMGFHACRLRGINDGKVAVSSSMISKEVAAYFKREYKFDPDLKFIKHHVSFFRFVGYGFWMCKEIFRRGFVYRKRLKHYYAVRPATFGLSRRILRDDFLVDGKNIKKTDILFVGHNLEDKMRQNAFQSEKEHGYDCLDLEQIPLNLYRPRWMAHVFLPILLLGNTLRSRGNLGFSCFLSFHSEALVAEILINFCRFDFFISDREWGDVARTVIFNRYGARTVLVQWSDQTSYKILTHQFPAHNIFLLWGDEHKMQMDHSYVDEVFSVGCIYKTERAVPVSAQELTRKYNNFDVNKKTVMFFDTSFGAYEQYTPVFYLEYLSLVSKFCVGHPGLNVILKAKNVSGDQELFCGTEISQYRTQMEQLKMFSNFIFMESRDFDFEDLLLFPEVAVSMGMNSPSTIFLICGGNGLYYDSTGNDRHPFSRKYQDQIVFSAKEKLFSQIDNILAGRVSCADIVQEKDLEGYDAFRDNSANERIRQYLLTKKGAAWN